MHVGNPLTILLWTDHHLLVPLVGLGIEDVAIIPWSWDLRKAMRGSQDGVELLDHVCVIAKGHRCFESTISSDL